MIPFTHIFTAWLIDIAIGCAAVDNSGSELRLIFLYLFTASCICVDVNYSSLNWKFFNWLILRYWYRQQEQLFFWQLAFDMLQALRLYWQPVQSLSRDVWVFRRWHIPLHLISIFSCVSGSCLPPLWSTLEWTTSPRLAQAMCRWRKRR